MDLFTLKHQMKINNEDGENEREREKHYAIKCSSQKVLLQQLNISFFPDPSAPNYCSTLGACFSTLLTLIELIQKANILLDLAGVPELA